MIRQQLMEKDQLLKANEERQQNQEKEIMEQLKKSPVQTIAKKKRIVYI